MRVAVVHDYFANLGGSDTVARALYDLFPGAQLYTLLIYKRNREAEVVRGIPLRTSFLQRLPFADRTHQPFLPLMPLAIETLDLREYDLVLSSSHTVAHGAIPGPGAAHICYCHTPMRYAWDMQETYLRELPAAARPVMRVVLHQLRQWDVTAAARVDRFVANSHFVEARIAKYYRRRATVIPPPVDVDYYRSTGTARDEFYLAAGRLTGYKRMDLALDAFAQLDRRLVVIGDGPERRRLERRASRNVTFLGAAPRETLRDYFSRCRALVFPGLEDFGILPLEAQACGAPVIAYGAGGALDTVIPDETGVLFAPQSAEALRAAVQRFEKLRFDPARLRAHAQAFCPENFQTRMKALIETHLP